MNSHNNPQKSQRIAIFIVVPSFSLAFPSSVQELANAQCNMAGTMSPHDST